MCEDKKPYSYHTFLFPFLWNDGGIVKRKDFEKCLNKNYWKKENELDCFAKGKLDLAYNKYQYFNTAARRAIYGGSEKEKNAVVYNYKCDITEFCKTRCFHENHNGNNLVQYKIEKIKEEHGIINKKTVFLNINGIRIKLFNTGIGILIFELENYKLPDEKDIVWINEFGRRIYMPWSAGGMCSNCADRISLVYADQEISVGTLTGTLNSPTEIRLIKPIVDLLSNDSYTVTTSPSQCKTDFFIEPIIDDRMYVACFYHNKAFVDDMSEVIEGQYSYLYDAEHKIPADINNNGKRLYEMIFIDGGGVSCHSRTMMKQLLEQHVYDRWLEYNDREEQGTYIKSGTLTGITEYSMVCVAASDEDYILNPFLTMYIEILVLTLAQRASLLAFEKEISNCAIEKQKIDKVQERYVLFQSQLSLEEVTPQQQGIELYKMLLEKMFIEKQTEDIEKQIDALFERKNYKNTSTENFILLGLATLGIFEAVDYVFEWIFKFVDNVYKLAISLLLAILAIVIFFKNR